MNRKMVASVCASVTKHSRLVAKLQSRDANVAASAQTSNNSNSTSHHLSNNYGIMDTGNNKQHVFKSQSFFNDGVIWHDVNITGVHGAKIVRVGIGTAYFSTVATDKSMVHWTAQRSLFNPTSPVNLLCVDVFHYLESGHTTGHEFKILDETLTTNKGKVIPVKRDNYTKLPLMEILSVDNTVLRLHKNKRKAFVHTLMLSLDTNTHTHTDTTATSKVSFFKHTQLQPLTTTNTMRILNNPNERYFNTTVTNKMITGIEKVVPARSTNKADRPDSWYAGKMTRRTVPSVSTRPPVVEMKAGSHIVSDIGYLPVADKDGHIYFVLLKDMCTQYRVVYRMKKKDDVIEIWKRYVTDNSWQDLQGRIYCRVSNFITDDDASYVKGEVAKVNKNKMIRQWVIAPYTHNANPAEQEMRRIMEGACSNLYDSGLGPSFLMDALCAHVETVNCMFTPVCNIKGHEFKSPYERMFKVKPDIKDMARFGCKTHVYVDKDLRKKHQPHSWVGFYLGRTPNMKGSRIYRPIQNRVYDRYHCLHDCGIVYGDLMGAMYKARIECDKQQREYYNDEVRSILGNRDSKQVVLELLRQLPWAIQPLPEEHVDTTPVATSSTGKRARVTVPVSLRRSVRCSSATNSNTLSTPSPYTREEAHSMLEGPVSPAQQCVPTHIPPLVQPVTPSHTPSIHPPLTPMPQASAVSPRMTPANTITRSDAVRLLEGVPAKIMQAMVQAVMLTYNYHDNMIGITMDDEMMESTTTHVYNALHNAEVDSVDLIEDPSSFKLLQLCEATSRRIANSKVPATNKQVRDLEGTVEHKLIVEAMTDEIMWLINEGKVVAHNKKNIKNLYEIDGKWVHKYKKTLDGLLERVRSRWVLRGDKQRPYKDYDPRETSSPVATKTATLTIFVIAVQYMLLLFTLDVSKAFTVSKLGQEGVYMKVPDFFNTSVHPDIAPFGTDTTFELLTTLYGLRQAAYKYYTTFAEVILAYTDPQGNKYRRSQADPCVFTKGELKFGTTTYITFSIHIDDKFIACATVELLEELCQVLKVAKFVHTVEPMNKVLGMGLHYVKYEKGVPGSGSLSVEHDQFISESFNAVKHHFAHQSARELPLSTKLGTCKDPHPVPKFNFERYKLFRSILGKVSHCSQITHPEICCAVSMVSRRMQNPSDLDLEKAWHILCYLYGTVGKAECRFTIRHNPMFAEGVAKRQSPIHLLCDANLGNPVDSRSRFGFASYLFGNLVGWLSKLQASVALSTAESEYVGISKSAQFALWYKQLVSSMGLELAYYEPIVILSDSLSAINISNSNECVVGKYTKHILYKVHWFREFIRDGTLRMLHVPGTENISDIFTKLLSKKPFRQFRDQLLRGDFRVLRKIKGLECAMRYLLITDPTNCTDCNCHNIAFFCKTVEEIEYLPHSTQSHPHV